MAQIQHLKNAPIVEAMIDVRVAASPAFRGEDFAAVQDELKKSFPQVEERRGVSWQLALGGDQLKDESPHRREQGVHAYFFRSQDGKDVAQFRVDGFTFNRLAPYTSWTEILPRAIELLEVYVSAAKPRSITRIATRYINRLRLPSNRFADYLARPPRALPGVEGTMISFMETTSTSADFGTAVNVAQALELPVAEPETPAVILDVDAFITGTFTPKVAHIRDQFDVLHELKNRVFFGLLTDSAVRLYL